MSCNGRRLGKRLYPALGSQAAASALRNPSGSDLMARKSVRAGPLGFFAPRSHSWTVRTLNSYAAANSACVIPVARLIARTSTSGAISGAASRLDAICRAMSPSVIASILRQFVLASALRAALLMPFAIALHLSSICLPKRDHPSFTVPIDVNADKKTAIDQAEGDLADLAIVEAIIVH